VALPNATPFQPPELPVCAVKSTGLMEVPFTTSEPFSAQFTWQ
jgi:hypothetical protein